MAISEQGSAELTVRLRSVVFEAGIAGSAGATEQPEPERNDEFLPRGAELVRRVAAAFSRMPPTEIERRIIEVLMVRPGATLMALSSACGWSRPIWHTHFNLMVQRREEWLGSARGGFPGAVLANYESQSCAFTMRPEAAAVFAELGIGNS